MKLSNQAMGALMMALQKSLLEQTDIVPILKSFDFGKSTETGRWGTRDGELIISNPPTFKFGEGDFGTEEGIETRGSD
jgi:hypothetical protein